MNCNLDANVFYKWNVSYTIQIDYQAKIKLQFIKIKI